VGGDGRSLCVNDAGNKELVGGAAMNREEWRTLLQEARTLSVVFPMMMMMMMMIMMMMHQ
jgi:hypothetical protein